MMRSGRFLRIGGSYTAIALALPGIVHAQSEPAAPAEEASGSEEVIVTGVLGTRAIEKAPVAVTAIDSAAVARQAPTGAAEILRNVPGVFVSSAAGTTRSIIFSRGVSANSNEAAAGYYYVSLQEDGLPVEPMLAGNFGPDYFTRPDIMLNRVEALRGGTAAITGPNAPGGIFNYLTRDGRANPGTEVRFAIGLEGDGSNLSYRTDFYSGGEIGPSLYYAIGGFYRQARGARDLGYDFEKGGQVRGNLLWEYDRGTITVGAKYLDDHNGFWGFVPFVNYRDPKIAPGFGNDSTMLLSDDAGFSFVDRFGATRSFDPADTVHNRSLAFNAEWRHDLSDAIEIVNKTRYSINKSSWNSLAVDPILPLNDFLYNFLAGNIVGPGTFTFRNPDGSIAATMRENIFVIGGQVVPSLTVTQNNLPNQLLPNAILPGIAYMPRFEARDFQNQMTFTAHLGDHTVSIGAYVAIGDLDLTNQDAGFQFAPYQSNPFRYDVTYAADAVPGATFQVTNPQGWAAISSFLGGDRQFSKQNQYSVFIGDTWQVNDRLTLEAGVRFEKITYDVVNDIAAPAPVLLGPGGADGNPLTLYDNGYRPFSGQTRLKRDFNFVNYSVSASYSISDDVNAYIRYTDGKKAPDLTILGAIETSAAIATQFPDPQHIQQLEAGLKVRGDWFNVQLFPFYSHLSNVASRQTFFDGSGVAYSPPALAGEIKTYGVEIQGFVRLGEKFEFTTAVTLQSARASGFGTWVENTPSRDDDAFVTIPSGKADNNPDIITRSTLTYFPVETVRLFVTHSYLGSRPANRFEAFKLPGFHTVDFGAIWEPSERFALQFNVNNVFDDYGLMGWSPSGSFTSSLDRQTLTPALVAANPNGPFTGLITPPRSFLLTATVKW